MGARNRKQRVFSICIGCEHEQLGNDDRLCVCDLDDKEITLRRKGFVPPRKCPHAKEHQRVMFRNIHICERCRCLKKFKTDVWGRGHDHDYMQCMIFDTFMVEKCNWNYCPIDIEDERRCEMYAEYFVLESSRE